MSAAPEEGDVVHDLLAYLAERMIDMNKDKLQAEFKASVGNLAPLLMNIETTSKLIDKIIYKLYGTEEEMKIVEESISGGKDAKETGIAR